MTLTQQQVCVQEVDMVTCRCGDKMKPVEKVMPAYLGIRMQGFLRQSEDKNKVFLINSWYLFIEVVSAKKNKLKSISFDVMQTDFFAFTCKFGLVV